MLKELGLTTQEERVYKALLELGTTTTGPLCKHANIASSHVYHVLDKLVTKGLVSFQEKNNRKEYFVAPPEVAQTMFERRLQELEKEKKQITKQQQEHLKLLQQLKPHIKRGVYFKYFENISGIKALYTEIAQAMQEDPSHELIIFSNKPADVKKLAGFYDEFHQKRNACGVLYKAIFDTSFKERAKKRPNSLIKFMKLTNDTAWGIYNDYFFIYHIASNKPYGILIKDSLIANTFVLTFETILDNLQ